jgi:hypothetical protein
MEVDMFMNLRFHYLFIQESEARGARGVWGFWGFWGLKTENRKLKIDSLFPSRQQLPKKYIYILFYFIIFFRVRAMVVTRTFSDGRTDDQTMAAGASVT